MSWRDQYQPGSFRGVPFRTAGGEQSGGRRMVLHEFPGRDTPLVEDMGRRARQFSIDCHVIGRDYHAARDQLIEALEAAGPGLLVHPWRGQTMVVVLEFSCSESTEDGGMCSFRVTFGEAGQAVAAPVSVPAGQAADIAARAQLAAGPAAFAGRFSIDGMAAFVEQSAGELISGMATVSQIAAGMQGGTGPALHAFEAGLRFLPGNLASLLRAPLNLGHALTGLVSAVALLGPGPRSRSLALAHMIDWQPVIPAFPVLTPARRREQENTRSLLWLFRAAVAAELVRTAAAAPYASHEEATETRDAVAGRLDSLALEAADRGDDARAESFDALRRALVRDIAARVPGLARVWQIETVQPEPALVVAQRIYGHAGVAARAEEIAARNRIRHPGFIPAGFPLRLLTAENAV